LIGDLVDKSILNLAKKIYFILVLMRIKKKKLCIKKVKKKGIQNVLMNGLIA